MKAHISKKETLRGDLEAQMQKVRLHGLAAGAKAVSQVIYEKATAKDKTAEERLNDVINFCLTGINAEDSLKKNIAKEEPQGCNSKQGMK